MKVMKFGYFGVPHIGGTYTVYRSLRDGLALHGIDVRWIGVGPKQGEILNNPAWAAEMAHGVVVAEDTESERLQGEVLVKYLEAECYDGVFVNVLADRVPTNAVRYLRGDVIRILLVHNITLGTYAAARAVRDYIHAAVGVSPRIKIDLIKKLGFDARRTFCVPNAIDLAAFTAVQRSESDGPVRLIALGRVVDSDKGVFWLPKILDELADLNVRLTVVGDGPDLSELQRRCAHLKERVFFYGGIAPPAVPQMLAAHDVFLFPSRFEGLPLSLVEAMAAGCVPVASHIRQVTDFVVNDGVDGFLFAIGDSGAAARAVRQLEADRSLLCRMSDAARENIRGRFDLPDMAKAYADLLRETIQSPAHLPRPLPMDAWSYPRGLKPGLRSYLPKGVKNFLRTWRERCAI